MSYYHCLKCGEKLKELSSHEWTDKYKCLNCDTEWFRVKHLIIEWLDVENLVVEGKKKESEVEHDA